MGFNIQQYRQAVEKGLRSMGGLLYYENKHKLSQFSDMVVYTHLAGHCDAYTIHFGDCRTHPAHKRVNLVLNVLLTKPVLKGVHGDLFSTNDTSVIAASSHSLVFRVAMMSAAMMMIRMMMTLKKLRFKMGFNKIDKRSRKA